MSPSLASLIGALALVTGVSAAQADTIVRFPPKGGIPYAVQVPDRPSAAAPRRSTIKEGAARTEWRLGRRVAKRR